MKILLIVALMLATSTAILASPTVSADTCQQQVVDDGGLVCSTILTAESSVGAVCSKLAHSTCLE
jgi:hypothetical protein